jgi:hypothetical protein
MAATMPRPTSSLGAGSDGGVAGSEVERGSGLRVWRVAPYACPPPS